MKIALLATGGTVAMSSNLSDGAKPTIGAEEIAVHAGSNGTVLVAPRQVLQKPSASVSLRDVETLVHAINTALSQEDCAGVVVTHGTDTLEETSFALCAMLRTEAPVVLTGAMRTSDQPGADGPANIGAAVQVAASQEARGIGPLVVFADEIHAAALVRKSHTHRPAAFTSAPFGPLGFLAEGRVRLALKPVPLPGKALLPGPRIPPVPILQVGMDLEPETMEAFERSPLGGLVLAAAGGGHVSARSVAAICDLAARVPVVLTSRTLAGEVLTRTYGYAGGELDLIRHGVIPGGRLNPVKARVLLQLLASGGQDVRAGFMSFNG